MAPRIFFFFSIAMVADYSFDVKNIDIWAPAFFKHNNSFIATVEGPGREPDMTATWYSAILIENYAIGPPCPLSYLVD
jgi:hypothetical protein